MNSSRQLLRFSLPLVLVALGALILAALYPAEVAAVKQQFAGFPDSDEATQRARPWVIAGMCGLPALAGIFYALGDTLDRYVTRSFLGVFGICAGGLFTVWLLMDLSDNAADLPGIGAKWFFYSTRAPAIVMLLLPYSLLLSLLFSLGKLSSHRELIAMIQAGRSVLRLALPLVMAGALFSVLCLGLNYHWAPMAEGRVREILAQAKGEMATAAVNVLYRNPDERRLWRIGVFPENYETGKPLRDVEVTLSRFDQTLERRISAEQASWDGATSRWTFEGAVVREFQAGAAPTLEKWNGPLVMSGWSETPWQLIKPGLAPKFLGIPDLSGWLAANARHGAFAESAPYLTQWHYRLALPFSCLVTVLLATPLGVHFSRRGSSGGVFMAVVLSALMLLVSSFCIALGESGTLSAVAAAWLPNGLFAAIGLYLFRRRLTGQPIYQSLRRFFS